MGQLISEKYAEWERNCNERFAKLKANEERLNTIFIDAYGLQNELSPAVADKDITVRHADVQREIRSLISYAVGCIFGRYSVDRSGICCACKKIDMSCYKTIIPKHDNIVTLTGYLPGSDLTALVIDFVRKVYGDDTLGDNMTFIADSLGGGDMPHNVIRNYLMNSFFTDHCRIYQKRPIYWQFTSGKKNAFKALVYMHRWNSETVSDILYNYIPQINSRLQQQLSFAGISIAYANNIEKPKLKKLQEKIAGKIAELNAYSEKLKIIADMKLDIEPDNGVHANYELFSSVLEKIK